MATRHKVIFRYLFHIVVYGSRTTLSCLSNSHKTTMEITTCKNGLFLLKQAGPMALGFPIKIIFIFNPLKRQHFCHTWPFLFWIKKRPFGNPGALDPACFDCNDKVEEVCMENNKWGRRTSVGLPSGKKGAR